MVAFYNHSEDQAGFHFDGSTWTRFGPPPTGDPTAGNYNVSAAAAVASAPLHVYAVEADTNVLSISSDGGLTWTQRTITGLPTSPTPAIFSLWARAVGEVYLLEARGNAGMDGIWRTLDDGVTWARIVPFSLGLNGFGSHMAVGTSKLFYAVHLSTSPDTWHINRCNLDGTGIETWASHTFTPGGVTAGILLRAMADDFVIATKFPSGAAAPVGFVWKVDASGITDVRPSGLNRPWDALPLTVTQWLAVGGVSTSPFEDVQVYRTTDAGATWTSVVNAADPLDDFGDWTVFGPGGMASVCPTVVTVSIPSRLATIVG